MNLEQVTGQSTTATDLNNKLQSKLPTVYYPHLQDYHDIDQIFGNHDSFLLMYMKSPDFGHWVLVSKSKQNPLTLEYFDPFGKPIDHYLQEFAYDCGAQYPGSDYLIRLMKQSRYTKLLENRTDLQLDDPAIQTCGKWCLLRHLLLFVPMCKFDQFFDSIDPTVRDMTLSAIV